MQKPAPQKRRPRGSGRHPVMPVRIDQETKDLIAKLAEANGQNLSEAVRELLATALENERATAT